MITLTLTPQMLNIIGEALGNAPYKLAAPVIAEIQKQVTAQETPPKDDEVKDALAA